MSEINNLSKIITEIVKESQSKGTEPYDTAADVVRVEDGIAWVHIPGGVDETPAQMTVDALPGDSVQIRVSGGRAWLTGNASRPPTDDTIAKDANIKATRLQGEVQRINNYFWHDLDGAHVSTTPGDALNGNNVLLDSDSLDVRVGETVRASFGQSTQIGESENIHVKIQKDRFEIEGDYALKMLSICGEEGEQPLRMMASTIGSTTSLTVNDYSIVRGSSVKVRWKGETATFTQGRAETIDAGSVTFNYDGNVTFGAESETTTEGTFILEGVRAALKGYYVFGVVNEDTEYGDFSFTMSPNKTSKATGMGAVAMGDYVYALADGSAAFNSATATENAVNSFCANNGITTAYGAFSANKGNAKARYSAAFGEGTESGLEAQFVCGTYNANWLDGVFVIGNGTSVENKSSAFVVYKDGNYKIALDTTAIPSSTDGKLYSAIRTLGWEAEVLD